MKDHMESLFVLPFSIDCITKSSTDVATTKPNKPHPPPGSNSFLTRRKGGVEERLPLPEMKRKRSWGFLARRRSFISRGIHKLITTLKTFSQLFVYNEEMEEEEEEMEMEIGLPTDVKHVTHIGLDGSMTNPAKAQAQGQAPQPQLLSLPSVSLRQFELAMAAQATKINT